MLTPTGLLPQNNLSDLASAATARSSLGLSSYVVPPGTTPADLSGLVSWYKAEASGFALGESMTSWPDSSPSGYNLTPGTGTQATLSADGVGRLGVLFVPGSAPYANATAPINPAAHTYAFVITPTHAAVQFQAIVMSAAAGLKHVAFFSFGGLELYTNGGPATPNNYIPTPGPLVVIMATDGTNCVIRCNGAEFTSAFAVSSSVLSGMSINSSAASSWPFNGMIHELATFSRSLTAGERRTLELNLAQKWRAPLPGVVGKTGLGLAFDGDSIMAGTKAEKYAGTSSELIATWIGRDTVEYRNFGITGAALPSAPAANVAAFPSAVRSKNVVLLAAGINNLTGGQTAAAIWSAAQSYATAAKAAGYDFVVYRTPGPSTLLTGGQEAVRQAFLRLVEANWRTTAIDAISHLGIDPRMGAAGTAANTTYVGDGTHATVAGHRIQADHDQAALLSLGVIPGRRYDVAQFFGSTTDAATPIPIKGYKLPYNSTTSLRVRGSARRTDSGTETLFFDKEFRITVGAAAGTPTVTTRVIAANDYATLSTADLTCVVVGDRGVDLVITGEAGKAIAWVANVETGTISP